MAVKNNFLQTFVKFSAILIISFCNDLFANNEIQNLGKESEIVISASALKASAVAVQDFEKTFSKNYSNANEVGIFLSDIRNYEVKIIEKKSVYVIMFSPKKYNGQDLIGGGAMYEVSRFTYLVTQKELFE